MTGKSGEPRPHVDAAVVREAFREFVLAHEAELRALVLDVLKTTPGLVDLGKSRRAAAVDGELLKRIVRAELAGSPLAQRAVAPGRTLGLFPPDEAGPPLPPARHFAAAGVSSWNVPDLHGEPLEAFLERDLHPLPRTEDREGYHDDRHLDYWLSGLGDFLRVRAVLQRHGRELAAPFTCLDFGCATGRVLRHFLCQARGLDLWGADLNEAHVAWLLRHMPASIKAFQCTSLPFLPLEDGTLDLVTAFSVFTHIDEFETAWLFELRRVLKPGGMAYLTIHSDETWARMRPGFAAYDNTFANRDWIPEYDVRPELFQRPMPREKVVFRWRSVELYNTNVFVTARHVREVWGRAFDILEIIPQGASYQDVVVLRKPE